MSRLSLNYANLETIKKKLIVIISSSIKYYIILKTSYFEFSITHDNQLSLFFIYYFS